MELAISQAATLVASEIQYATYAQVDHVRRCEGTGSMSLLLHLGLTPAEIAFDSSIQDEGLTKLARRDNRAMVVEAIIRRQCGELYNKRPREAEVRDHRVGTGAEHE